MKRNLPSVWLVFESRMRRSRPEGRQVAVRSHIRSILTCLFVQDVKKDEEEFRKTQEAEKIKQAKTRKVQENVNKAREQNARRKMDKVRIVFQPCLFRLS